MKNPLLKKPGLTLDQERAVEAVFRYIQPMLPSIVGAKLEISTDDILSNTRGHEFDGAVEKQCIEFLQEVGYKVTHGRVGHENGPEGWIIQFVGLKLMHAIEYITSEVIGMDHTVLVSFESINAHLTVGGYKHLNGEEKDLLLTRFLPEEEGIDSIEKLEVNATPNDPTMKSGYLGWNITPL